MSEHATRIRTLATTSRLPRRLRAGILASMAMLTGVAVAHAVTVETAEVAPPVTIELRLNSALPAYDIAWSDHAKAACQALADQAIEAMDDPTTPYVLQIPQIPVVWKPLPASFSSTAATPRPVTSRRSARRRTARPQSRPGVADMNGAPIDRQLINRGRINYERDLEVALLDIVSLIRDERPGALLTIDRFVSPQSSGARSDAYLELQNSLDFLVLEMPKATKPKARGVSARNRRSRARAQVVTKAVDYQSAFTMADAPDGMWVAVDADGKWTAVDDDPLPEEVIDGPDENANDWSEDVAPELGAEPPATPDVDVDLSGGVVNTSDTTPDPPVLQNNPPNNPTDNNNSNPPPPPPPPADDNGSTTNDGGGIDVPPPPPSDGDGSATGDGDGSTNDSGDGATTDGSTGDTTGDGQPTGGGGTTDTTTPGAVGPILVPGAGFTSLTPLPATVGAGSGSDAKAIARWDVVPYQTFTGQFTVGVVAFHINGIERVEFSTNGGPWTPVYDMQLNPRTNVWEYFATLNASDFADGPVEVRAVAYPTVGVPRVLAGPIDGGPDAHNGNHSIFISANAGSSLWTGEYYVSWTGGSDDSGVGSLANPFQTIGKALAQGRTDHPDSIGDGVKILLMAGDHPSYSQSGVGGAWLGHTVTQSRFVTITRAPGLTQSQVRLFSGYYSGLRTKLVHVKGITVRASLRQSLPTNGDKALLWAEDCNFVGAGRNEKISFVDPSGYKAGAYVSESILQSVNKGFLGTALVRNTSIRDIAGDALVNVAAIFNTSIDDTAPLPGDGMHADIVQYFAVDPGLENIIIYNLHATNTYAQGWHIGYTGHQVGPLWRDFAFVNVLLDQPSAFSTQWIPSANHVLWWNLTIPAGPVVLRNNPTSGAGTGEILTIANFSMRNCIFNSLGVRGEDVSPSLTDQSWAKSNHYIDTTIHGAVSPGADATTGGSLATLFVSPSQGDYKPKAGAILTNRVSALSLVSSVDALNREITQIPAAIGALQQLP